MQVSKSSITHPIQPNTAQCNFYSALCASILEHFKMNKVKISKVALNFLKELL